MMQNLQEEQDFLQQLHAFRQKIDHDSLAQTLKQLDAQKEHGKCDLLPLPPVPLQPFRSELTLERHPLFVVNSYKGDSFSYQKIIHHPETKEPIVQTVRVGKLDEKSSRSYGVLKQSHQHVFYKLLKLWGQKGYPLDGSNGVLSCTVYDLVLALRGDDAAHHYRRVRVLLRDLSSIPITMENAYTWQGLQDLNEFTLLEGVRWNVSKLDKETLRPKPGGTSHVEILLSKNVTEGFLRKHVKKLLFHPYQSLGAGGKGRRAEIARLLYPILDHELSSKDHFHIALKTLAQRLGLAPQPYKSYRRRPFASALKLLQDKEILAGKYLLELRLVDSADGQDDVLVASKSPYQMTLKGI